MRKFFLFLVTTLVALTSCKDNYSPTDAELNEEVSLAKEWYNTQSSNQQFGIPNFAQELDWTQALMFCTDLSHVVEVPIELKSNFKSTADNNSKNNIELRLLLFAEGDNYSTALTFIVSERNTNEYLGSMNNINYEYIDENFNGSIHLFNQERKSIGDNTFEDGKRISDFSKLKTEPKDCYQIVEVLSDGSTRPVSPIYCRDASPIGGGSGDSGSSGGGSYGGNPGGGDPGPDPAEQQIKWSSFNSTPKKITNCDDLTSISKKNWFEISNGEKIAHILDAMRHENKALQNEGYIDLNQIFNFGNFGTDNYAPELAGRVDINGVTLDIIASISIMGDDTSSTEGVNYSVPKANGESVNGYIKTGYWTGFRYSTKNSLMGGAPILDLQIKLGETSNPFTNADIFLNALTECEN